MRNRLILSLLSGLLMGVSLPMQWGHWTPPNLGFLAWIALVPLILATQGLTPGRAYRVALPGMLLAHGIMVYWFYTAIHVFGHLGAATSVFLTLLGILFLASITSLSPCLVAWINRRHAHWWAWPLVWAAIEYGRNFDPFLQGFTFCNLIHSQYRYPLLFQIVNVVGPYWFLAMIVLVNVFAVRVIASLAEAWRSSVHQRDCFARIASGLAMTCGVFAILVSYGLYSRHHYQTATRHWPWLRVALLQGNIPQDEKWATQMAPRNFQVYQKDSIEVLASKPDLIVWPEASYPWTFDLAEKNLPEGQGLPALPILMGTITQEGSVYHNSALLLGPDGQAVDVVHKYHLVPFGEYVPYQKILFFAKQLTRAVGNLQPAASLRPLMLEGLPLGMLICYEDTFPEIARSLVAQGSVLLVNITNDAWYGWSPAAMQHTAASVFRAAENGRYLVRATNSGVSAVIGPDGGIQLASSLYERALIVAEVKLGVARTLYNRYGGGIDWSLVVVVLAAMVYAARSGCCQMSLNRPTTN
jgi:apolipoprotein N-acyltransferase